MEFPTKLDVGQAWHDAARCLIECAVLSYRPEEEVRDLLECKAEHFEWFEAQGRFVDTEAFGCVLKNDVILAFWGTAGLRDVLSDVTSTRKTLTGFQHLTQLPKIKAHDGFRRCLDSIWSDDSNSRAHAKSKKGPTVPEFLIKHADGKTIWLTGHSLGGAIATIAAARIEAPDSPFKGRLGGLFTIGSPRALNSKGAKALMATLGTNKVFRIVRARDPIPLVPRLRYKHVSGTRVFVTNKGDLVIGSSKWKQRAESLLCWLQGVEDALGSVLPGQHHGLIGLISHHSSADYLKAVHGWKPANKHSIRGILGMTLAPIKIVLAMVVGVGVAWAVWSAWSIIMMRMFG